MPGLLAVIITRTRTPVTLAAAATLAVSAFLGPRWLAWTASAVFAVGLVSLYLPAAALGAGQRTPVEVRPPVRGRWVAVNSPADRVPSHGMHAYGQTYAIDLVYHPDQDRPWAGTVRRPLASRPEAFPGFGQPVLAPADGVVLRVRDHQRDHWSRNSWPALIYLVAEGVVREALGPGRILGNHIVLDLGDGVYAAFAHLRRGSARVERGQRVTAGQQLAECGNSGNSTEPHVHFQLMDHPRVLLAGGVPFRFGGFGDSGGVPAAKQPFTVPAVPVRCRPSGTPG